MSKRIEKLVEKWMKYQTVLSMIVLISCLFTPPVSAGDRVLTDVWVIHASTGGPSYVDPGLKGIIPELKSVFKYTSYRLINTQQMPLRFSQEGRVNLPGNRTMMIKPMDMDNKRIRYRINIRKNGKIMFKTQVLLRNNSRITIGGPRFKKGHLLFLIQGSAP